MHNTYPYMPDEFKDKRVLVTGDTKDAGESMCAALHLPEPPLLRLRVLLCRRDRSALFVQVDLGSVGVSRSLPTAS